MWFLNRINNLVNRPPNELINDSNSNNSNPIENINSYPMNRANVKGLTNYPGENNCFLNSAIQVLWQLDIFRNSFRDLEGHYCLQNSCIFCALKILFTQYEYNDMDCLPPYVLRKALADYFYNEKRFSLGEMDDAAEVFENILKQIHFHLVNGVNNEYTMFCLTEFCVTHRIFSMNVNEKFVCNKCDKTLWRQSYSQLVYYINVITFLNESTKKTCYGNMLKNANKSIETLTCPNEPSCGKTAYLKTYLDNCPDVITIGISWNTNSSEKSTIMSLLNSIQEAFEIQDLFDSIECLHDAYEKGDYRLKALICYYGRHYTAFCFSNKLNEWLYLDDTIVNRVGPLWEMVLKKCLNSHYQPYLLFYCANRPSELNTKNAPKQTHILNQNNE